MSSIVYLIIDKLKRDILHELSSICTDENELKEVIDLYFKEYDLILSLPKKSSEVYRDRKKYDLRLISNTIAWWRFGDEFDPEGNKYANRDTIPYPHGFASGRIYDRINSHHLFVADHDRVSYGIDGNPSIIGSHATNANGSTALEAQDDFFNGQDWFFVEDTVDSTYSDKTVQIPAITFPSASEIFGEE